MPEKTTYADITNAGKDILLVSDISNQLLLLTNSANTVLQHLNNKGDAKSRENTNSKNYNTSSSNNNSNYHQHPVGRYIINSLSNFYERYGDGSGTVVIMLNAALREVQTK